jgi:hypothetical protein
MNTFSFTIFFVGGCVSILILGIKANPEHLELLATIASVTFWTWMFTWCAFFYVRRAASGQAAKQIGTTEGSSC